MDDDVDTVPEPRGGSDEAFEVDAKSVVARWRAERDGAPAPVREPPREITRDRRVHGWLCPTHSMAAIKTSAKGRVHVGCPECHAFARLEPSTEASEGCPECSAILRESPSAIAGLATLIRTDAHRDHRPVRPPDDLPF